MKKLSFLFLSFFLVQNVYADDAVLTQGREAFVSYCSRCHGPDGKGDGPDSKRTSVLPRDLTSGRFKFKTTVSGTPPSDEDLKATLRRGLPGSGMPSFGNLEADTLNSLIQYVKTLSPAFTPQNPPKPIPLPSNYKGKIDPIKGKEVFKTLQCALCHGPEGRANGTSAFTLMDGWNHPIRPANLTQGWTYRGGQKPSDIYYRIFAGLDGAPMPSYDGAVTPEDAWQLANYVSSLQLKANWTYEIIAVNISGALPAAADDPQWEKAPRTDVNLQGYFYENGRRDRTSVNAVSVQVLRNEKDVAFRLQWNDPVKDEKNPADAFSVAFKPRDYAGDPRGNLHTLYTPESAPLDLMMWQAGEPAQVGQKVSTFGSAVRPGWTPAQTFKASSEYKDGAWVLVFSRPLDLGNTGADFTQPFVFAGFTAWDGHNGDSQLKHSTSQWIRLVLRQTEEQH